MYLFIDTTQDITVGIFDKDYQWLCYDHFEGKKGSAVIHQIINDQVDKLNLSIQKLEGLIQVAGPGSYTGMRVSDGISQIFSWQNFKTYSFYHFEVPKLLGVKTGHWVANAFKGEIFDYYWDESSEKKSLIKQNEFNQADDMSYYSSFNKKENFEHITLTSKMIYNDIAKLMEQVISNNFKQPLYYYRDIEQEYSRKEK